MSDLNHLVKNIDTVLFDMDGTIVNTEPLHAKAAALVLTQFGINIDLESMIHLYSGMTDTAVLKLTCPDLTDQQIDDTILKKNIELMKIFDSLLASEKNQYITPGLFPFLQFLVNENKNLGVVSASEDIIVMKTLACFNIDSYMTLKMGRQQTPLTKPHPDPYLEGMRRFKATPLKTLIFEDSATGLKAAIASGAQVIRITQFSHSPNSLHLHERLNFL